VVGFAFAKKETRHMLYDLFEH